MAKTNLQRNTSYYERMIEEAKKSSHAPHYGEVCTVLKDLAVLIVKFENKFPGILEECKKMLELEKPAMQKTEQSQPEMEEQGMERE